MAPLAAQTPAPPVPALEAGTSTPAPAKKEKKGEISISIGGDSPDSDEVNSRLTQEQLYHIQLARAQNSGREHLTEILVPTGFFAMIVGIVGIVVWGRLRRNRMMHETARLFAEKGQPLPAEFFASPQDKSGRSADVFAGVFPPRKVKSDLRRGIFWVAVGLGVIGYFIADHDSDWGFGLIPFFIGVGYLVAWKLETPPKSEPRV